MSRGVELTRTMTPGLYRTDEEVADSLGVGVDKWRSAAAVLEKEGLPPRDKLFANRWYWPSIRQFLDRRYGLDAASGPFKLDGKEDFKWLKEKRQA